MKNNNAIDLKDYVLNLQNDDKKQYMLDILDKIFSEKDFIAYHGSCTDGSITAALMAFLEPTKTYIPLDYNVLKDKVLRPFLKDQNWFAILDLEPFNNKPLELYIDHHRSVIGTKINAKRIHFEVGKFGPSAAYVLYNAFSNINNIPAYLNQLVEVSRVTDTASFAIDPPIEIINKSDLSFLKDFDQLCWFIQDATNIEDDYSLEKNNELVFGMKEKGLESLLSAERIDCVNNQREKRRKANNFVDSLEILPLMVIVNAPDNTYRQYISLILGKRGAKVIVFLSQKQNENLVTISLRQSKLNTENEIEYYSLDLFAKQFNESGGGHSEAAGSVSSSLEEALHVVKKWAKNKKLKYSVLEFR